MADTDTQAPAGISPDAIARLYQQLMAPPPALPTGTPDNGASPSWTGLLGRVLGGGQAPGYQLRGGEADTSGNRALLNFGINTLLASGPHAVRPDLLSSVATGLQGAQESANLDQSRAGALAAAQFQAQREGRQDQLARIKEAIPLLSLQARRLQAAGIAPEPADVRRGAQSRQVQAPVDRSRRQTPTRCPPGRVADAHRSRVLVEPGLHTGTGRRDHGRWPRRGEQFQSRRQRRQRRTCDGPTSTRETAGEMVKRYGPNPTRRGSRMSSPPGR